MAQGTTLSEEDIVQLSKEDIVQLLNKHSDSLGILVAGKTGVGKSALINSLARKEVAKEGNSATPVTGCISKYPVKYVSEGKEYTVTFWDIPGFGDVYRRDDETIKKVQELVKDVHVILYCFDIRQRLCTDDAAGFIRIAKEIGHDVWENMVFVLTFANQLLPPPSKGDRVTFFKEKFESYKGEIKTLNEKCNVPQDNIHIAVAGYHGEPPPQCDNWKICLWEKIVAAVKTDGISLVIKACNSKPENDYLTVIAAVAIAGAVGAVIGFCLAGPPGAAAGASAGAKGAGVAGTVTVTAAATGITVTEALLYTGYGAAGVTMVGISRLA